MASGTVVVVPSNAQNVIQTAPGLPGVALQASGATPNPQYGAQQLGISTSAPQQVPQKGPMERFLSAEAKVLGAVQIMIGLVHIGFGVVSLYLIHSSYFILSGIGGYPFWGGIFFISSGSLCVAAVNRPNRGLVKSSVAMNVISAIITLIGVILYIFEIMSNNRIRYIGQYNTESLILPEQNIGYGLCGLLFLFNLLEFCIAVSIAHFGCQATCCSDDQPTIHFVPYQVIGDGAVRTEPNPSPPPPTYDNAVTKSP
ncbi:membrane-spanning 4-domains subfamily A member 15-like isoform X1 [Crotalus tigris]|uniref:membrane-spanning 4-domains subfamily A member 15-like isoform X1 n=1 Tax=Crotalus tigris TaxID=88082 RepID=UPI00192FB54A|nr:membrane-spanning 4-domains subfamily A member 15-like isoform X1 [Crotalus tigris]XP_039200155.1 membrane-spanning 4-domains subfamily A member 15-like isoform X1 [Crotalus tigris]XP_039200156.1 membrane-spanning 4-domains subfamily A member 15-like isoform X1 [Crotalus tigris]